MPDHRVLRAFDPYQSGGERQPGIYTDVMEVVSSNLNHQSACLVFYENKLKKGLRSDSGDVDLLGHESGKTLADKKAELEQFQNDIKSIEVLLNSLYFNRSIPLRHYSALNSDSKYKKKNTHL